LCADTLPVTPELHQLNFGFLVSNDFLRKPTHLGILAVEKFRSRHVNGSLVMGQHQVREVRIFVLGWFHGSHGCVHRFHVLHQGDPACIGGRMILRPHGDRDY
jgi:hypothetical protein